MKATATKIAEGVYWIGVIDWDIRNYHGYQLKGTTYNCFLVFGAEKTVLIDNSYPGTAGQLLGRMNDAFEKEGKEAKIDVIIQNHIEKDHSGTIIDVLKKFPNVEVYASAKGASGLKEHYSQLMDLDINIVKTGDELDIGGRTLAFVSAPMLHWPDSMFTMLIEEGILFSNDAFGQHICTTQRFDYEIPDNVMLESAQKFYANLVTPFSPMVLRKLDEVNKLGLLDQIKIIAPSHGLILTKPETIINAYTEWASGVCKDKMTIVFDTMHYSTQKMAHAIAEGAISEGVEVVMYNLTTDERSEIVKDILNSKALLIGSPTMYNGPFPSLGDVMYYLEGLSFDKTGFKRLACTFGSKGWAGGATKKLGESLETAGFELVDTIDFTFIPTAEDLDACFDLGKTISEKLKEL